MRYIYIILIALFSQSLMAQSIDKLLKQYRSTTIPYMSVQELAMPKTDVIILDSREAKEYKTSHLKGAINVGYDYFQLDSIEKIIPNKSTPIVVYCSVGIRSELIADSLKRAGYDQVKNLYGGIFEWKNNDFPVYNSKDIETDSVHTFSKEWSKWLKKGTKIYE